MALSSTCCRDRQRHRALRARVQTCAGSQMESWNEGRREENMAATAATISAISAITAEGFSTSLTVNSDRPFTEKSTLGVI